MSQTRVTSRFYNLQQRIASGVALRVATLWEHLGPVGFSDEVAAAAGTLAVGQLAVAQSVTPYLEASLKTQGVSSRPDGEVVPRAFSGVAASGRSLESVLSIPSQRFSAYTAAGMPLGEASVRSKAELVTMARNEVQQAGINATQAGMVGQKGFVGYIRYVSAPSCSRCTVLAGKYYRKSSGFQRHPGCDCYHLPATADNAGKYAKVAEGIPEEAFDRLTSKQQDRYFSVSGAEAIREGASPASVTKLSGLQTYQVGSINTTAQRMPIGEIFKEAKGSNSKALDLLYSSGYLR